MTAASSQNDMSAAHRPGEGSLANQIRVTAALAIAGAVFWTVGWVAVQPIDPRGPLTVLAVARPITTLLMLAPLSIVAGGLAVLVAGRAHINIGGIAAGVGLAALNLHGTQADKVGGYIGATPAWPTTSFIFELWLWLAVIGLGLAAGRWCHGWMFSETKSPGAEATRIDASLTSVLPAILLTALAAYLALPYLSGPARDEVLKFQIYFAVGGSVLIGAAAGQLMFKPNAAWWPLVAVGIVGTIAYLTASPAIRGDISPYLPLRYLPGVIARPLPIEFASLGAIGGLLGLSATQWFANLESMAEA